MDYIMPPYIVYAKVSAAGIITAVNSSAFLADTEGWVEIDSGHGDRYHHAQGNYFSAPLVDDRGVYRYKLVDGKIVERTAAEMDADYTPPEASPTEAERIDALERENAMLLECVLEMSEILYA